MMYRGVVVALLLAVVGGCTSALGVPAPGMTQAVQKARTVGVISAVGTTFALQKIGVTVFGNELNEVPIAAWGLDEAVTSRVSALLAKRFTVKRIAVPQGVFDAYYTPSGAFGDSDATLQGVVRKLAGSANCDLVIVVTRAGASFSGTNQFVAGVGMVERAGALNPDNVTLFAVTTVQLYNGHTFERLVWQRPGFAIGGGGIINGPNRALDHTWWPATPQGVHSDKIKAATRALLVDSIAATVPAMVGLKGTGKKGGA